MMDWISLPSELVVRGVSDVVNQTDDPRVGSGRANATGGTISHVTSSGTTSSSASSLGSTFLPVLVFSAVCMTIFVTFRRTCPRVYAPRSIPGIRNPDELTPKLPSGWIDWIVPFFKISDAFVLNHCSLDGYLFLRYIKVLAIICFAGCVISWPVLLTVNGTGGNDQKQLDLMTIGNVAFPIRFYAHAIIAYVFFGFILFMVSRECVFYINLRQAYLLAPQQAHSLSARTVLFTCVPKRFQDERRIRKLFGDSVKNVWLLRNTKDLQRLVDEREETAIRLEKAETELIKKAHAARIKKTGGQPLLFSLPGLRLSPARLSAASSSSSTTAPTSPLSAPSSPSPSSTSSSSSSSSSTSSSSSSIAVQSSPSSSVVNSPALGFHSLVKAISEPGRAALKGRPRADSPGGTPRDTPGDLPAAERHASVSDAAPRPPTAALDAAFSPRPDGMEELSDVEQKDAVNRLTVEVSGNEDEKDDEASYVHPYGYAATLPDVRGSVAAQWLPAEKRPTHRPLANFGRSVDTIRWTRMRLKALNQSIARTRRRLRAGDGDPLSAVFVEFDTQAAAQVAFQVLSHHQPLHMSPCFIGIRPNDVIWSSLRMRWWERIIRRFAIMALVAAGVIFWSVPSAFVGIVSNVKFLSTKVPFLHWIGHLPSAITGVIEGLLPALALSLLMAAVPFMLRWCARQAGVPSAPMVELFTQNAYFLFQVVQVFLVTTLTSAASAAFSKILQDPLSVKDLLSENLPKASNFYLSYITVQCLAGGASGLVHLMDLFRHGLLSRTIENPRRAYKMWHRLKQPHWGSIFPVFTNMGVIAISYACISPLILAFAGVGMCFVYYVYRYNLLFTYDTDLDSRGLHYPQALMHLLVGLYMAQICLIGLFSLQSAIGPVVMMATFLLFTIIVHLSLNDAVYPLLASLPQTLALEDEDLAGVDEEDEAAEPHGSNSNSSGGGGGLASEYYDLEEGYGQDDPEDHLHEGPVTTRGIDGAGGLMAILSDWTKKAIKEKIKTEVKTICDDAKSFSFGRFMPWKPRSGAGEEEGKGPNFFIRWLHPEVYEDYMFLRKMMPLDPPPLVVPEQLAGRGYWQPEMWKPIPKLWIPRDEARVSRQEVAHTRTVVPITDKGAWLNPKGQVVADLNQAPFREPRFLF